MPEATVLPPDQNVAPYADCRDQDAQAYSNPQRDVGYGQPEGLWIQHRVLSISLLFGPSPRNFTAKPSCVWTRGPRAP